MAGVGLLKWFVIAGAMALLVANLGLFPEVKFNSFKPDPLIELRGPFEYNERLRDSEKLFQDKLLGPESLVEYKGAIFTGLESGELVKIEGTKYTVLPEISGGVNPRTRLLGLRLYKDKILGVCGYNGLYSVDPKTYKSELLLSSHDKNGQVIYNFMDDLDIDSETDTVYISLASSTYTVEESFLSYMAFENSGKIIQFNLKTKKVDVVLENLHFPNGIQLSKDRQSLLFSETFRFRVMKYHLKGAKKGNLEVFANLPGSPDNIRSNPRGKYWVALPLARNKTTLIEDLADYPEVRKYLFRTSLVIGTVLKKVHNYYPNPTLHKLAEACKMGAILLFVKPVQCMIVELDENGKVTQTLQSSDQEHCTVSEVLESRGHLYLGSFGNPYIIKTKLK